MSSPPGKFKCSAPEWFSCPEGITPNSGLTGPNNTPIYIYIYIYSVEELWSYILCFSTHIYSGVVMIRNVYVHCHTSRYIYLGVIL